MGLTEVFLLLQQDSLAILIRAYGQQGWQCDGGTGGRFQKQLGVKNNNVPALPNTSSSPSVAQKVKEGRKEGKKWKTHRKVGVKVVLPVKERLLVYGAAQSQSRHDCCLHASSVQNLRRRRDTS